MATPAHIHLWRFPHIALSAGLIVLTATAIAYAYIQDSRYLARPLPSIASNELPAQTPTAPTKPLLPISQVHELALMGQKPVEPAPLTVPAIEDIPDTTLNLTLMGVFASEDPSVAAALIKVSGQSPKYFRMGAEVVPGATLEIVAADGITLRSAQAYEKLMFARNGIWKETPAASLAELQSRRPAPALPQRQAPTNDPAQALPVHRPAQATHTPLTTTAAHTSTANRTESVAHLSLQERLARLRASMPYN